MNQIWTKKILSGDIIFLKTNRIEKSWKPDWRNPTQESMISRKVYHGGNEKQPLAVPNHTERLGMETMISTKILLSS